MVKKEPSLQQLLEEAKKLVRNVSLSRLRLARVLHTLYADRSKYPDWQDYLVEIGVSYGTAMQLVRAQRVILRFQMSDKSAQHVGVEKLAMLSKVASTDKGHAWLVKAMNCSPEELRAAIRVRNPAAERAKFSVSIDKPLKARLDNVLDRLGGSREQALERLLIVGEFHLKSQVHKITIRSPATEQPALASVPAPAKAVA